MPAEKPTLFLTTRWTLVGPRAEFAEALRFRWKLGWIVFGWPAAAGARGAMVLRNNSRVFPITGVETNKDY
jgi:hypothetical protein